MSEKKPTNKSIVKNPIQIKISCDCGENVIFDFGEWETNIVGILEFRCPKCRKIYRTKGLWIE